MSSDASRRLHALFRASVVIGCVALLLGVAGIFHFGRRDREARPAQLDGAPIVRLSGLKSADRIEIVMHWVGPDGLPREEKGHPSGEPNHWRFYRAPEGTPLELFVYGSSEFPRLLLARQPAVLTRGAVFEAVLQQR